MVQKWGGQRRNYWLQLLVLTWVMLASAGCYFQDGVAANQVGLQMDGGRVNNCVGAGIYTDFNFFADLRQIPADTSVFEYSDPQVSTNDKQLVGVTVTVQVRRKTDCDSLRNLVSNWSSIADNNEQMGKLIGSLVNSSMKVGVYQFSLDSLLADRNGLAGKIEGDLRTELAKSSIEVTNVSIKDVAINAAYAKVLDDKALLTVQIETEKRKQDLIKQQAENARLEQDQKALTLAAQLSAEQAKTKVELEIAARDGALTSERNKVYQLNPAALELERLKLLQGVLGDKATIYFITPGTNISLLLGQFSGTPVPVIGPTK